MCETERLRECVLLFRFGAVNRALKGTNVVEFRGSPVGKKELALNVPFGVKWRFRKNTQGG